MEVRDALDFGIARGHSSEGEWGGSGFGPPEIWCHVGVEPKIGGKLPNHPF